MRKLLGLLLLLAFLALPASAQTVGPVRDPNAVALASQALQALTGGTALTDVTLQATATYIAGSDQESGPATLVALGNQQSRVTLNLTNGQRQEIRRGFAGAWIGADGTPHTMASHNNLVDASWFYPVLTLQALANDPTLGISLVGQETRGAEPVFHLMLTRRLGAKDSKMIAFIQHISAMSLYLDASSLQPVALDFNIHPDRDTGVDIPVEIRFGAYQTFNGVQAPTRIQKYVQNSLALDLVVANSAVNSGVPPTLYILPNIPAGGAQ